jgi:DNA-directed RNA polymerase specialized sigma24 family protein
LERAVLLGSVRDTRRMALGRTVWTITPDAFERLLSSFDADREQAGRKYENLRRKLLEFFEARGSRTPDEHADETLNRVARKLNEGEAIENLNKYCYGVAKYLWMEVSRNQNKEPVALDDNYLSSAASEADDEEQEQLRLKRERRLECFEECLRKLPDETRIFIVEYYREENGLKIQQRKLQAERLKTTLNALRLRASRLRRDLGACINSCLSSQADR